MNRIINLAKIPLGKTYSQKEHIMGSGIIVPSASTSSKVIAEADPDRVVSSFMSDLGTFRNGNRSKILKNHI